MLMLLNKTMEIITKHKILQSGDKYIYVSNIFFELLRKIYLGGIALEEEEKNDTMYKDLHKFLYNAIEEHKY